MRAARSIAEFVHAPQQRFVAGRSYLAWCAADDLCGTILWGRPTEEEVEALTRAWEYDRALPGTFDVISDLSRVSFVEPGAFARLAAYVTSRRQDFDARVRRHALVRPSGLPGAAVSGFNLLIDARFAWRVVDSLNETFAWLERDGNELIPWLDRVAAQHSDELVAQLQALLSTDLTLELAQAAAQLGLAPRSLQRRLGDANTSFRDELARARVARARNHLAQDDAKLEVVAQRVGLASASQLVRLFRRQTGESPASYRQRIRV